MNAYMSCCCIPEGECYDIQCDKDWLQCRFVFSVEGDYSYRDDYKKADCENDEGGQGATRILRSDDRDVHTWVHCQFDCYLKRTADNTFRLSPDDQPNPSTFDPIKEKYIFNVQVDIDCTVRDRYLSEVFGDFPEPREVINTDIDTQPKYTFGYPGSKNLHFNYQGWGIRVSEYQRFEPPCTFGAPTVCRAVTTISGISVLFEEETRNWGTGHPDPYDETTTSHGMFALDCYTEGDDFYDPADDDAVNDCQELPVTTWYGNIAKTAMERYDIPYTQFFDNDCQMQTESNLAPGTDVRSVYEDSDEYTTYPDTCPLGFYEEGSTDKKAYGNFFGALISVTPIDNPFP